MTLPSSLGDRARSCLKKERNRQKEKGRKKERKKEERKRNNDRERKERERGQVWCCMPVIPATREAEAGELLETRKRKSQ